MPLTIRRMASGRLALLHAFTARNAEVLEQWENYKRVSTDGGVASLKAWDNLFFGWALAIATLDSENGSVPNHDLPVMSLLRSAESFFGRHGLVPAQSLARSVIAESPYLHGDTDQALATLRSDEILENDLALALGALPRRHTAAALPTRRSAGDSISRGNRQGTQRQWQVARDPTSLPADATPAMARVRVGSMPHTRVDAAPSRKRAIILTTFPGSRCARRSKLTTANFRHHSAASWPGDPAPGPARRRAPQRSMGQSRPSRMRACC
jgi:hypothetical protein